MLCCLGYDFIQVDAGLADAGAPLPALVVLGELRLAPPRGEVGGLFLGIRGLGPAGTPRLKGPIHLVRPPGKGFQVLFA